MHNFVLRTNSRITSHAEKEIGTSANFASEKEEAMMAKVFNL